MAVVAQRTVFRNTPVALLVAGLAVLLICALFISLAGAAWTSPQQISQSYTSFLRPSIAIGPDNTVHAVWTDSFYGDRDTYAHYGKNSGSGWPSSPQVVSGSALSSMGLVNWPVPVIAVDGLGHVYIAWQQPEVVGGHVFGEIYMRRWDGAAWSAVQNVSGTSGISSKNPTIAADDTGKVHIAWIEGDPGNINYRSWDGTTWSAVADISRNSWGSSTPSIAVDKAGTKPRVAWSESPSEYGGEAVINYRERSGGTWGTDTVRDVSATLPGGLYSQPQVTTDASGNSHLLVRIYTSKLNLYYTSSTDSGVHWSAAANLSAATSGHVIDSSFAVDDNGIVRAVYIKATDMAATFGDTIYYTNGSGAAFTTPAAVTVPAGATKFRQARLGTDLLDRVHLVYDAEPVGGGGIFTYVYYTQLQSFLVTAPNGGETINGATTVTAAGRGAGNIARYVTFTASDGIFSQVIGSDDTPDNGWSAPWNTRWTPPGSNYKVTAYGKDGFFQIVTTDDSNNPFTVTNTTVFPTLSVIKPDSSQAAHDRIGGSAAQLQARVSGDTQGLVDSVRFYQHQNGGYWILLGEGVKSGNDWNYTWNVSALADGDGYQILAKAYHNDGGWNYQVATAMSSIFEVRNSPIVSIFNQAGLVEGSRHLYIRKDWDPNNRVSYAILSQTHGGGGGVMGYAYAAAPGNPCAAGGYSCLDYFWNTSSPTNPEADDYAITADAYSATNQQVASTVKSPFIVQNDSVKFIRPTANSTIKWPIEVTARKRDDVANISAATFAFKCGGGSPVALTQVSDYRAKLDPRTSGVACAGGQGGITASYTVGGTPTTTTVSGLTTQVYPPQVTVTPGSADPNNRAFITNTTTISATIMDGWDPVPVDDIIPAQLQLTGTRDGNTVTLMSDDMDGSDGWSWQVDTSDPEFFDGYYEAKIIVYWRADPASPRVPQEIWTGYYTVNNVSEPATVTQEQLPDTLKQMDSEYSFSYLVHNPDQIAQTVSLTLSETGTVNTMANDWLDLGYSPMAYHDKVNGVEKTSATASWTQTVTIPPDQTVSIVFPVKHHWQWLAPTTGGSFTATDYIFKLNDIASWWSAVGEIAGWSSACEGLGMVGTGVQGGVMVAQVFTGAVAMDYQYQVTSNIAGMTGLTASREVVNRIPDGKLIPLFDGYLASIAGSTSTALAVGFIECPPCSAALFVNEVVDWGIAQAAADAAADPDPNYKTTARPADLVLPYMDTIAEGEGKEAASDAMDTYDAMHYMSVSLARMEGAQAAGDDTWAARQLEAAAAASQEAGDKLQAQSVSVRAFQDQLQSMGYDLTVDDVADAQQQIKDDGSLPSPEVIMLGQMGFTSQQIEELEQGFLRGSPTEVAEDEKLAGSLDDMLVQHDKLTEDLNRQRDEMKQRTYYFTWYDEKSPGMSDWVLGANPGGGQSDTELDVFTAGNKRNTVPYVLSPGGITTPRFPGVMEGPVKLVSRFGQPQIASQRILFGSSFEEVPGFDETRLTDQYYFTWYDEKSPGSANWVLFANPSASDPIEVDITISDPLHPGDTPLVDESITLAPGRIATPHYPGIMGGPVKIKAHAIGDAGAPRNVITSQRVLWQGRFNEVLGVPGTELDSDYIWTWYDEHSPGASNWVLVANPSEDYSIYAEVYIGQSDVPVWKTDGQDGRPASIERGGIQTPRFGGVMGGPVRVKAWKDDSKITPAVVIASQRSLWGGSFEEVPGSPLSRVDALANFSWYDQKSPGSFNWVMVANPGASTAKAEIWIAGQQQAVLDVGAGGSNSTTFPNFMGGPVEVRGYDAATYNPATPGTPNHGLMASQRVLWQNNFNEVLGVTLE